MKHLLFINSFENDAVKSLLYAAELAQSLGAQLHILHLVREDLTPLLFTTSQYLLADKVQEYLKNLDQKQLGRIHEIQAKIQLIAGETLPINWTIDRVSQENIVEGIETILEEVTLDMIVIGNYLANQYGNKQIIEELINETQLPILLIPSFQRFYPLKKWLFLSEYLQEDLEHLEQLKYWFVGQKCEIDVVHFKSHKLLGEDKKRVKQTLCDWEQFAGNDLKLNLQEIEKGLSMSKYLDLEFSGFTTIYDFLCLTSKQRNTFEKILSYNTSLKIAQKMLVPVLIFRKS